MRRALILILLLAGMQIIRPLGVETPSSQALLTFGFLILAAYTVGEILGGVGLPKLVGYMVAGIIFGPSGMHTLSSDVLTRLAPVNQLAVSLIAFMAGAELQWSEVKQRGIGYVKILTADMGLTFVVVVGATVALRSSIPVLGDRPTSNVIVFALLLAVVLVAHSPAATLGLMTETKARGPVARTTLGVVLVSDVALVVLFSVVVTACRLVVPPPGTGALPSLSMIVWELAGAVVIGAAIGGAVALYLRFVVRDLLLFGIIAAMLGAEIARLAHVELLLTLLVAGFVTENLAREGRGQELREAVERAAAPIFVVFFALSGASIRISDAVAVISIVAPLTLLRAVSIWIGTSAGARWAGIPRSEGRQIWRGLIAQAGVAIGLTAIIVGVYPELGAALRTIALSVIAINQLIGPILFRRALRTAGEIPQEQDTNKVALESA
jgi:Kef-type K+ transport system membrane component KefB